jgi:hypothetical protein
MVLIVMGRLPLAIVAATLLLPATAGQAGARASGRAAQCGPAHAEPILADSQAEIYLEVLGGPPSSALGCVYGHRHPVLLGVDNEGCAGSAGSCTGGVERLTLNGTVAAYDAGQGADYHVVARDLRSGRILRRALAGARPGIGPATAIVTTSSGALAWIVEVEEENETTKAPAVYEVRAADKSGVRVLASGSGIVPNSLALAGNTVYWTQGGKAASTTLN